MDVLSLKGYPLGAWIPGVGGLFGAPQYHLFAGYQDDRRQNCLDRRIRPIIFKSAFAGSRYSRAPG
jgi:hypothetical protein